MNSESLQFLCTSAMLVGLVFAGFGGLGIYYFGRVSCHEKEMKHAAGVAELDAKLAGLQGANEDLRQRLELELAAAKMTAALLTNIPSRPPQAQESKAPMAGVAKHSPGSQPAKTQTPLPADTGTVEPTVPTLEQLIESAAMLESGKKGGVIE